MAKSNYFQLDALDASGRGLRAKFARTGDGFAESIWAVTTDAEALLLEAEGIAPWQEIVEHALPDGRRTLLLTGAGGGRYWSAALTPLNDNRLTLLGFDFACRGGSVAAPPKVKYRVAVGVTTRQDGNAVAIASCVGEFQVRPAPMPAGISTELVDAARVIEDGPVIEVGAAAAPHASTRETIQWRFELSALRSG